MRNFLVIWIVIFFTAAAVKAQDTTPANALKASYDTAFTLYRAGNAVKAIPYLQKVVAGNASPQLTAGSYSLLGSIYTGRRELSKAIEAYQNALKADGTNKRIYYNLGIAYFMGKQYADAEVNFIRAVKQDAEYADSQRMYALAAFHQNKRAEALLGLCRFLISEPNTARSAEAYGNVQSILKGGTLPLEAGYKPLAGTKALAAAQNQVLAKALAAVVNRKFASPTDKLSAQLTAVFKALATAPRDKEYFWHSLADYFGKLAQTDQITLFVRIISQTAITANERWVKENPEKIAEIKIQ